MRLLGPRMCYRSRRSGDLAPDVFTWRMNDTLVGRACPLLTLESESQSVNLRVLRNL